ncbi:MAG: hypothetical protein JXR34_09885, partial [Bacteroidales bacterium]|nr:hypothetical protein [Bacteroidales bacterium]
TLSYRQLLNGFAEIIKIGFITNEQLYQQSKLIQGVKNVDYSLLKLAIEAKLKITHEDPFEQNQRRLLNFGHTIGHAIESVAMDDSPDSLLHGEAVAMGMLAESFISMKMNLLSESDYLDLKDFVLKYYSDSLSYVPNFERISRYLVSDKKNTTNGINFSLPIGIGLGKIDVYPSEALIRESLSFLQSL